ncbi:MAG: Asp-tRNA(Asn)/Glu-tRNA(Gln) amidotransferase subunit GatB [Nitrospirae bacterium]|nr:Asp-tRNA(Asn)/Glu-tRNA(Gln) amidotransferase subunit GatB [Nitrospirota bacterium]
MRASEGRTSSGGVPRAGSCPGFRSRWPWALRPAPPPTRGRPKQPREQWQPRCDRESDVSCAPPCALLGVSVRCVKLFHDVPPRPLSLGHPWATQALSLTCAPPTAIVPRTLAREYETVIGLEAHAHLKTRTKLFCACSAQPDPAPNSHVCPVCTGMPGVLPVMNKEAVRLAVRTALAMSCRVQTASVMARKNYFYPDLPKNYQISQYERPLATDGEVPFHVQGTRRTVRLVRIHMEEDAGRLLHEGGASLVDYNRCGVPLVEIVSQPDLRTPEEAAEYLKALRNILRYIGASEANMEEGNLRCDANISIRPAGDGALGTKVEIKNMNSFRHVQQALAFEAKRQAELTDRGGRVAQETRLWDPEALATRSMRSKEEAHDYRYFPDPDLLPLSVPQIWVDEIAREIPELPAQKIEKYTRDLGLPASDAQTLVDDLELVAFFEEALRSYPEARPLANWLTSELVGLLRQAGKTIAGGPVGPTALAGLLGEVDSGRISGKMGKELLAEMVSTGASAASIIEKKGLRQITDEGDLERVVDSLIAKFPNERKRVEAGEIKLMQFFVGQAMKETGGKANPPKLQAILRRKFRLS